MASIYGNLLKQKSVCIRKEFNSHSICLEHQHGRRFIVLVYQYGRRDVKWRHSVISANRHFEKHSDVPYKPLKAALARQIKIICSIKCDSFFFFFSVSSVFASEDQLKGVAVMCHFATPTERDQLNDSNSCTRLSNGNWNELLTEWFSKRAQSNLTNWIKNNTYTHTFISKMIMLRSILKVIFKTDLSYLLSLDFVLLSLVFVHVLFSCFDLLFLLVLEVMLSSRIYLLPY